MLKIKFYDLKNKKFFTTDKYKTVRKKTKRGMRSFAVAKSPQGVESWKVLGK